MKIEPKLKSALKRLWRLMEGQRLRYGSAIGALLLGSCFMYVIPLTPQIIIDGVLTPPSEKTQGYVTTLVRLFGGAEFLGAHLWIPGVAMLILTGFAGLFSYLRGRWSAYASQAICLRVRNEIYDHLQHLPCAYHDKAETGDLVQRCSSDIDTLNGFLATQVVEVGRAMLMLLIPLPLMLMLDVRMTLISVAAVPPVVAFSYFYFHRVRARFKQVDEAEGHMTTTLQENLTGIRVVRAFARQTFEEEKFDEKNLAHRGLQYSLYILFAWYWAISDMLCMGQKVLVVALGGYWLHTGQLQLGAFFFFMAAVGLFIWPIRMLGRILAELGKATVAIDRIAEVLDENRETGPAQPMSTSEKAQPAVGHIACDRISFSYDGKDEALANVSFNLQPGQTLALLGPSGSGKSTLVHLLMRYYDPSKGALTLDGVDLTTRDRKWVRAQIALVMQEPFLYSKTLRDNIHLGAADAKEHAITEAAMTACVHDAIEQFEQGYDTRVGERGVTLSGGQRQRVAIARALLDNKPILILDDAFSAVDTETEALIQDALKRRHHKQTTIVIAHRVSTLMHADQILVLDKGRVIQQGTHAELLKEEGRYQRIWELQSKAAVELAAGEG